MKLIAQTMTVLIACLLSAEHLPAQAIIEYGKGLERVSPPTGGGIKAPGAARRGSSQGQGASADIPPVVLPVSLRVKEEEAQVYAQQDEYSARVEKAQRGTALTPMGQATMNGEKWYMVRSQQGTIGWVKAALLEEIWPAAPAKESKQQQVKKRK